MTVIILFCFVLFLFRCTNYINTYTTSQISYPSKLDLFLVVQNESWMLQTRSVRAFLGKNCYKLLIISIKITLLFLKPLITPQRLASYIQSEIQLLYLQEIT